MFEITANHYKILKRAEHGSLLYKDLPQRTISMCDFLVKRGCLVEGDFTTDGNTFDLHPLWYELTEYGRLTMLNYRSEVLHWRIPLAISIFALLKSYGLGIDDLFILCTQLLTR